MVHACNFFFFFNDTATTEIYTLSLHDALPISTGLRDDGWLDVRGSPLTSAAKLTERFRRPNYGSDRKSTRLNSSHLVISYAVFCLKKKKRARSSNRLPDHSPFRAII